MQRATIHGKRLSLMGTLGGMMVAILALAIVIGHAGIADAQDATPAPLEYPIAPGVTAEEVAPPDGPPALFRVQIAAGATWQASDGTDPSIGLVYLETGELTITLQAPMTVFRASAADHAGEVIPNGTPFTVGPGDYFVAPPSTAGTVSNAGTSPATMILANIFPPSADGAMATPAS